MNILKVATDNNYPINSSVNMIMDYLQSEEQDSSYNINDVPSKYKVYITSDYANTCRKLQLNPSYISDFIRGLRATGGILLSISPLSQTPNAYVQAIIALPDTVSAKNNMENIGIVSLSENIPHLHVESSNELDSFFS